MPPLPAQAPCFQEVVGLRELIRIFKRFCQDFSGYGRAHCPRGNQSSRFTGRQERMAKQTRLTFETDSLLILQAGNSKRAWCPRCGAEVGMIAMQDTGVISNLEKSELEDWFNSGELHRLQADDGSALICLHSLLAHVHKAQTS